jgi:hypothetical protein
MGAILVAASGDYNAIRVKAGITTDDLSDADIDTIGLLPVAEAEITSVVTDYAAILAAGGANKVFLQAAAISLCAALATGLLEMKRSQSFKLADYSESESKVDWKAKVTMLMQEAQGYLMRISTHAHTRRTLFSATGPTSSASSWPLELQRWYARVQPHVLTWIIEGGQRLYGWEQQP